MYASRARIRWQWLSAIALLLPGHVPAQQASQGEDPPGRAGRISVLTGTVSFQASGDTLWSDATQNYTVTTGDRLYTAAGSRAEVEVGMFAVRAGSATDLTVTNLTDHLMQLGLAQGTLRVTVYRLDPNDTVEVDTPNGALTLGAIGNYRVDIPPDGGSTRVSVDHGSVEVTGPGMSELVHSGQAVLLTGADPIVLASVGRPAPDAFDQWSGGRDSRFAASSCSKYMSGDIPGCADLGDNGRFVSDPTYGTVWYPTAVPVGWVPYRSGEWVWVDPWGWTWVEDEPWGYAPFHYGRWAYVGTSWGWVPGPVMARPYYAPALVAFVGGASFSVGFNVGVQAWFPLGPREPFFPWYHYSPGYLMVANQTNVRGVADINVFVHPANIASIRYVNQTRAITVVPATAFASGRPIARAVLRPTPAQLAHIEIAPHPSIAPTQAAMGGGRISAVRPPVVGRPAMITAAPVARGAASASVARGAAAAPVVRGAASAPVARGAVAAAPRAGAPAAAGRRPIITRAPPPVTQPTIAARSQAMAQHPGRPLEPQQTKNLQAGRPAGPQKDAEYPPHAAPPPAKKPPPPPPKKPPAPPPSGGDR